MGLMHRVRTVWTGVPGSPAYTNLYAVLGDGTPGEFHDAVSSMIGSLSSVVDQDVTWTVESEIPVIDTVTGEVQSVEAVVPTTGTGETHDGLLPPATSILMKWRTGVFLAGRQIQGRTYLPYIGANVSADGNVYPASITSVRNAMSVYVTALDGQAVVWSRKNGVAVPINSWDCWNKFAVMRSRRD
uniref:Uncharacterized protein n=1 Tax=uncultured prokaryote TaxID=198431 RepID=A0A0H5Q6C6_9ZZZZ|nr:hypothetical protein [uncultured prokaryote]